jgi:hypothetical protein
MSVTKNVNQLWHSSQIISATNSPPPPTYLKQEEEMVSVFQLNIIHLCVDHTVKLQKPAQL